MKKRMIGIILSVAMCLSTASAVTVLPECKVLDSSTLGTSTQREVMVTPIDNLNIDPIDDAVDERAEPSVEILYEGHELLDLSEGDMMVSSPTRGTRVPTSFWNLSTRGRYNASMPEGVGDNTLYTNYYFDFVPFTHTDADLEGVDDGKIYTKYNIYTYAGSTGTCRLRLTLHCKDCREELVTHTSNAAGASDRTGGPITTIAAFTSGYEHRNHFCYFTIENASIYPNMYGSIKIAHSNSDLN